MNSFINRQMLEAIGRLAGGVAQDCNNLLTAILGYAEKELSAPASEERSRASFRDIYEVAQRASGLTQQLLTFSLRQSLDPGAINLNDPIVKMERMMGRLLSEEVELVMNLEPGLNLVEVDPGQIEPVILNLVVNANNAMPDSGKLTIETKAITLDEDYVLQHPDASPGPHIELSFSDNGHGMSAEVMSRIFEAFFTTKKETQGAGLGLATSYGIVRQTSGHFVVSSQEGQGSTFRVYLPTAGTTSTADNHDGELSEMPLGNETILLVEDEPLVRKLASRTLRDLGYNVLETANGVEAEILAAGYTGTIDLLLADVVMPKMGGAELAGRLSASDRNMPALLMSGYVDSDSDVTGQLRNGVLSLQKPFTQSLLARMVREVLSGSNPSLQDTLVAPIRQAS